jgi:hypothetical protein
MKTTVRTGQFFTNNPHLQLKKEVTVLYIIKGKILSGNKYGESPEAKFSGDLKTHLEYLAILHFFTLIFITVW